VRDACCARRATAFERRPFHTESGRKEPSGWVTFIWLGGSRGGSLDGGRWRGLLEDDRAEYAVVAGAAGGGGSDPDFTTAKRAHREPGSAGPRLGQQRQHRVRSSILVGARVVGRRHDQGRSEAPRGRRLVLESLFSAAESSWSRPRVRVRRRVVARVVDQVRTWRREEIGRTCIGTIAGAASIRVPRALERRAKPEGSAVRGSCTVSRFAGRPAQAAGSTPSRGAVVRRA